MVPRISGKHEASAKLPGLVRALRRRPAMPAAGGGKGEADRALAPERDRRNSLAPCCWHRSAKIGGDSSFFR